MSKKIKQNRYKPDPAAESSGFWPDSTRVIDLCLKMIITVVFLSLLSLAGIYAYSFATQSNFFSIREVQTKGLQRLARSELLDLAGLKGETNIFKVRLGAIEKKLAEHPWVNSVHAARTMDRRLIIDITEHQPLAIVRIENLADILINRQGTPFKEYHPTEDMALGLPVISGLDLTRKDQTWMFDGPLFNAVMKLLKESHDSRIVRIKGDDNTGVTVEVDDTFNREEESDLPLIPVKLGFDDFQEKFRKAQQLSRYIDKNFPDRTISAIDLFDIHKVFIKTRIDQQLLTNIEKGV